MRGANASVVRLEFGKYMAKYRTESGELLLWAGESMVVSGSMVECHSAQTGRRDVRSMDGRGDSNRESEQGESSRVQEPVIVNGKMGNYGTMGRGQ